MLYSGYTFFTIPFAFAVGALVVRRVDADWIRVTRRFALASWMFLGIGILLGAHWSYYDLGWGGYWGWDPVEERGADAVADRHDGVPALGDDPGAPRHAERSGNRLARARHRHRRRSSASFLVRSGILNSIHAFGASTLGIPFVALIAAMVAGSVYLVVSRRDVLRSEHRLDSLLSREAVFLLNNVVLVGFVLRDLLGDVLSADLGGGDGDRGVSRGAVVRPLHPCRSRSCSCC